MDGVIAIVVAAIAAAGTVTAAVVPFLVGFAKRNTREHEEGQAAARERDERTQKRLDEVITVTRRTDERLTDHLEYHLHHQPKENTNVEAA